MGKWMLIMILVVTFVSIAYAETIAIFYVSLDFKDNDTVAVKKFEVIEGIAEVQSASGKYTVKIRGKDDNDLYQTSFSVQFETHEDIFIDGKMGAKAVPLNEIEINLKLPFNAEAEKLEVYSEGKKILAYQIELCNNNRVCEPIRSENYFSCPNDCSSGSNDNYCDRVLDGICDEDCKVKELDIDCTCGNHVCDERENAKLCKEDCGVSFWTWLINLIKKLFGI